MPDLIHKETDQESQTRGMPERASQIPSFAISVRTADAMPLGLCIAILTHCELPQEVVKPQGEYVLYTRLPMENRHCGRMKRILGCAIKEI